MRDGVYRITRRLSCPPLALLNVLHGGKRSLVTVVGMALAVVMVLLELGFLEAVRITAELNYDQLEFDIALVSAQFEQFYMPGQFPGARLMQARSLTEVAAARPLYSRMNFWRCPAYPPPTADESALPDRESGSSPNALARWWLGAQRPRPVQRRALLVLGIDPDKNPFRDTIRRQIEAAGTRLRETDRVLMNDRSNADFGWDQWPRFTGWELGGSRVEIIGPFSLTRSFGADAAVLCTASNFARSFRLASVDDSVNFGLITLRPGADPDQVAERLARALSPDVKVLSRRALYRIESDYWVRQTATGKIFSFGVFLTMVVAAVIVYQALAGDIRDHLPEYATLKAMGHTELDLARIIHSQAALYALGCYLPAVLLAAVVYRITDRLARIPMVLTGENLLTALVVTIVTSLVAGVLSLRKLRLADPADLFR
ncbi:MAG: FtsX-like permease family protein [Isosphaeraceae bacterium]|nr:FtsX-like permease family protein [Isosphaeraceae bacterium]